MYEFSLPMSHKKEYIDYILDINRKTQKSKITNLYFALPNNCDAYTGFEQIRCVFDGGIIPFDNFKPLIEYTLKNGLDFIYLLNSPRPLAIENPDFDKQLEKLDFLLNELKKLGVNKLRVSHPKLLSYLSIHYKDFDLYASTSFEYKTIKEFQNFVAMHPTVKQIVPSHDVTKNFKLLENIRKSLPSLDIELLVDEACIGGCPHRFAHSCEFPSFNNKIDVFLRSSYYNILCSSIAEKSPILHICKSNQIYPWELEEYSKIGINKFKIAGRDTPVYEDNIPLKYLMGVEDFKYVANECIDIFIYHLRGNRGLFSKYKVKDVKPYLPDINYFKKNGHLCASSCKVDCTYCYDCAKKIIEKFG